MWEIKLCKRDYTRSGTSRIITKVIVSGHYCDIRDLYLKANRNCSTEYRFVSLKVVSKLTELIGLMGTYRKSVDSPCNVGWWASRWSSAIPSYSVTNSVSLLFHSNRKISFRKTCKFMFFNTTIERSNGSLFLLSSTCPVALFTLSLYFILSQHNKIERIL